MADVWGSMGVSDGMELGGIDLSDTQWAYGKATVTTSPDIWDVLDLDKLFKLTKESKRSIEKFSTMMSSYRMKVARLPCLVKHLK